MVSRPSHTAPKPASDYVAYSSEPTGLPEFPGPGFGNPVQPGGFPGAGAVVPGGSPPPLAAASPSESKSGPFYIGDTWLNLDILYPTESAYNTPSSTELDIYIEYNNNVAALTALQMRFDFFKTNQEKSKTPMTEAQQLASDNYRRGCEVAARAMRAVRKMHNQQVEAAPLRALQMDVSTAQALLAQKDIAVAGASTAMKSLDGRSK